MNMVATQSIARWRGSPAIDERVAQIEANGAITFMHTDRQSSVVAISDSSGNVSAQNRRAYGTYGETNPAQMTGTGSHPFGYTGRRWDPDLNLYYYRARWYDPQLATFLETDPICSLDYVNLYAYVGLEPGNATDPSGMDSWLVSRPTQYWDAGHMFVVVTNPETGAVVARYSFSHTGTTKQSLAFQTKLVLVTGAARDPTNMADARAWGGFKTGNVNGASAVRIGASDAAVRAAGDKVTASTGTLQNPGNVTYVFYGPNSNAAAYAIANMAVRADGGKPGAQPTPGSQKHLGKGAYRQVEATVNQDQDQKNKPN